MVMKRDLYNEIGGFDEDCFMYSDDIDLSYIFAEIDGNDSQSDADCRVRQPASNRCRAAEARHF